MYNHGKCRMKNKIAISAALLPMALIFCPGEVKASQWGCEVLLCLSNPGGPMQFGECVPPITRLFNALSKVPPEPFPSCTLADGGTPGNYAEQVHSYYDPCPPGTTDAAEGEQLAEGTRRPGQPYNSVNGYNITQSARINLPNYQCMKEKGSCSSVRDKGPKACVTNRTGQYTYTVTTGSGKDRDSTTYSVNVYEKVFWQQPQSPRAIDVYIDGSLFKRVHW